jgi:PAS domain S-box-containing protein
MSEPIRVLRVDGTSGVPVVDRLSSSDERIAVDAVVGHDEALEALGEGGFDCVVSAYELPESDGVALLEAVREDHPDLPFVLVAEPGSEAIASEAISAGVTDYFGVDGDADQYAAIADSITAGVEEYRSRRDLAETERKLSQIAEHTDDVLFLFEGAWSDLLFVNSAYETVWGGSIEELERDSTSFLEHVHPEDREMAEASMERIIEGQPDTVEYRIVRAGGEVRWVRGENTPILDDDGNVDRIAGYVRDVTEARERERELREKSNLLDQLFKQVPIHMYLKDEEARHLRVSEHHTDDPGEYLGKTDRELFPGEFGERTYEDDMHVIETGEPIIDKEEFVPSREEWHLTSKVPWYSDEGEIRGLIGVTKSITERKQYEGELERQNDRLENFASVVSHDLRNPLNVARGRLDLAREECDSDHLADVAGAHERMETLIKDLLVLAREGRQVNEVEPVGLGECAGSAWYNVDTPGARLDLAVAFTVMADPSRLRQLFENLFRNAIEHGGSDVAVTVDELGDSVGFYVEDDGPGIPEEKRDRVFELGYSTTHDGTGFGLSIVNEIVEAHGWEITATQGRDGGARFEISDLETPS